MENLEEEYQTSDDLDDHTEEEYKGENQAPFKWNPDDIRITPKNLSLEYVLTQLQKHDMNLSPGFQRKKGLWEEDAQSRLIESLLVGIPIPAFYFDATEDRWVVIDGVQRLTAFARFVLDKGACEKLGLEKLNLCELEFLNLNGKTFDDLERHYQRRILETQLTVNIIEPGTHEDVKYYIFKRINTGGLPLSSQEIRHALNQGHATQLLTRLAKSEEFLTATDNSIKDIRRADQECVLRFIVFTLAPYTKYKTEDFDGFLNETMKHMNEMAGKDRALLTPKFMQAMVAAHKIFGTEAFRKKYSRDGKRYPINKALFEAWSVNLGQLDEWQISVLIEKKEMLMDKFIDLVINIDFNDAISFGTKTIKKVNLRFSRIEGIIQEVLSS
jgi:hypothetical protein